MTASDGVTVVGGGVVGLSSALRLAQAGATVRVLTADPPASTTSAVAAAIWSPYRAYPAALVDGWAAASYAVFAGLAAAEVPGVWMRPGRSLLRTGKEPSWLAVVPGAVVAPSSVAGVPAEVRVVVPVVDMSVYLAWLAARCVAAGVEITRGNVTALEDVPGSAVVLAAGLRSGPFVDDASAFPVRGQVVRVANPGLTTWTLDEQAEFGLTYVVPRGADVVCGGTDDEGEWSTELDPSVEQAILARCYELEPSLQGAPVLSRAVGLRPGRPAVRLERLDDSGRPVVCCYGHGGAGVTLSWGCAADVARLVLTP
ncbi:FAD-dependent oxidoreductase [Jatrophihabitans sp. YIM 134969]